MPRPISEASGDRIASGEPSVLVNGLEEVSVLRRVPRHTRDKSAVVGIVRAVDKGAKTAVVKSDDGAEHTFHFVGRTVEHGAEANATGGRDAFQGMKEGDHVIVHYTAKGSEKTATEIDHIGKDGVKMSEGAVKSLDHAAKTITVKTAEGGEQTYHLTDRAVHETGKGL